MITLNGLKQLEPVFDRFWDETVAAGHNNGGPPDENYRVVLWRVIEMEYSGGEVARLIEDEKLDRAKYDALMKRFVDQNKKFIEELHI